MNTCTATSWHNLCVPGWFTHCELLCREPLQAFLFLCICSQSLQETVLGKHIVAIMNVRAAHYSRTLRRSGVLFFFSSGRLLRSIASSAKGSDKYIWEGWRTRMKPSLRSHSLRGRNISRKRTRLVYAGWKHENASPTCHGKTIQFKSRISDVELFLNLHWTNQEHPMLDSCWLIRLLRHTFICFCLSIFAFRSFLRCKFNSTYGKENKWGYIRHCVNHVTRRIIGRLSDKLISGKYWYGCPPDRWKSA